ncbi:hypothetical protein ACROYT_G028205 [Oculina patagonica]
MFRKTSFVLIFCLLVQSSTGSANGKLQNASFKSVLGDKIPQSVDQTFNINNWGLGKIERKLLTDIKAKIDLLTEKVTGSSCPDGWVLRGKSCFLVIDIPTLKWSDARRTCQNLGGDLAIIRSAAENTFIFDLMKKQKTLTAYGAWLGLHRKADNKFYWVDDRSLAGQYSAWASGEPNSVSDKCGHMFGTGSTQGRWNDINL